MPATMGKRVTQVLENVVRGVEPVTPNSGGARRRRLGGGNGGGGGGAGAGAGAAPPDRYTAFIKAMQYRGGSYAILKCFVRRSFFVKTFFGGGIFNYYLLTHTVLY